MTSEPNPIHLGGGSYVVTMIERKPVAVPASASAHKPFTPEELAKKAAHRAMGEKMMGEK